MVKVFDVHFEIGTNGPPNSDFYAKVMLGKQGVIFQQDASTPAAAIAKIALDMENSGMWAIIAQNPSISSYPPGSMPTTKSPTPKTKVDPDAPKKKPMELTQVAHPDCQLLCTSFDFFGKGKCKSMCGQRSGL